MPGVMWPAKVLGPTIQVIVPSASSPASRSIRGARAATRMGNGRAPGTRSVIARAVRAAPAKSTLPSWTRGRRTDTYSRT